MPRFISPITDLKPLGSVSFFDSNTDAPKITFKDELESEALKNLPEVPVDANGNLPNIFFSGSAAVIYLDENGVQYAARNPVGEEAGIGNFNDYSNIVTYTISDIVIAPDGKTYISLTNGNQDNDPTLNPGDNDFWEEWPVNGIYNTKIPYVIGNVTQTTDGRLWRSLVVANLNNDPLTDSGANWITAGDDNTDIPNNQTGTSYTLLVTDKSKTVWMDSASANVLTIPTNASAAFAINDTLIIMQEGAGKTTITAASGVTLNGALAGSGEILAQYSGATLVKRSTDTWIVTGNMGNVS